MRFEKVYADILKPIREKLNENNQPQPKQVNPGSPEMGLYEGTSARSAGKKLRF